MPPWRTWRWCGEGAASGRAGGQGGVRGGGVLVPSPSPPGRRGGRCSRRSAAARRGDECDGEASRGWGGGARSTEEEGGAGAARRQQSAGAHEEDGAELAVDRRHGIVDAEGHRLRGATFRGEARRVNVLVGNSNAYRGDGARSGHQRYAEPSPIETKAARQRCARSAPASVQKTVKALHTAKRALAASHLADALLAEELARMPGERLVTRRVVAAAPLGKMGQVRHRSPQHPECMEYKYWHWRASAGRGLCTKASRFWAKVPNT